MTFFSQEELTGAGLLIEFRVTVWTLSAVAEVVDGDEAIRRRVMNIVAKDERDAEATVRDMYISDPDNNVWFGPFSVRKDWNKWVESRAS